MIYHITTHALWEKALNDGKDKGTYSHPSLKEEGFIHCSTREQLAETLTLYFSTEKEVLVLEIHERHVKDTLKWEVSRDGKEFPHIYGRIPLTAVLDLEIIFRDEQGDWVIGSE